MDQEKRFLLGAQYYRAPTPERENWRQDLRQMKELGLTDVKFWMQWRWCHRKKDIFYYEDIDCLMDLAQENGLRATLNLIFDVAPGWLYEEYPDCVQITADGRKVSPVSSAYRQIGGFPGSCYNHPESRKYREIFLRETVKRYRDHPAMDMWDVWNEPEQCSLYRKPEMETMTCYCPACTKKFIKSMQKKYKTIERVNQVWGKCFQSWEETELPRNPHTYADFIDFREFHLDGMTEEARWRIAAVKELDKKHPVYLHVVPNTAKIMNSITGVDDFALAGECDAFASTNFSSPIWSSLTLSAGKGKICYNAECHIGNGSTRMHQKHILYEDLLYDFLPQIGLGIRGFLFWQYRAEIFGFEAPAWGMTNLDGTPGCVAQAAALFAKKIECIKSELMESPPPAAKIAILRGRKNEIFSYAVWDGLEAYGDALEAYVNAIYDLNYESCFVDEGKVRTGKLEGSRLLILPECYCLDETMAEVVGEFVENGGHLLCEAHLGGYDITRGRHSYIMPGCGLDKRFGIRESWTTSPYYLESDLNREHVTEDLEEVAKLPREASAAQESLSDQGVIAYNNLPDDMKKAAEAYGGIESDDFRIEWDGKNHLFGKTRFASLAGNGIEPLGYFGQEVCIAEKKVGRGKVIYCGTDLGKGESLGRAGFREFLERVIQDAGIRHTLDHCKEGVHIDIINEDMIAIKNSTNEKVIISVEGSWKGVFQKHAAESCGKVEVFENEAEIFMKLKTTGHGFKN